MKKRMTTDELLAKIPMVTNLKDFFGDEMIPQPPPFHEYLRQLCQSRGEIAEHVIERAGLDRAYGHQLFGGRRKPSRDKVIQLAFGFGLNVEETQQLLKIAREPFLYPRLKRDAVIIYCITQNMGVTETQSLLVDFGLQPLFGE
ncbi:MAG: helix-turn-helix domain-containing protein [Clostridiales bacterium]|nr:helix-turn-helix domain-containing protein [Clostridiales bacterium]